MKAEDKQTLYNLLKTASSISNNGYVSSTFKDEVSFSDDGNNAQEVEIATSEVESVSPAPAETSNAPVAPASSTSLTELEQKIARCTRCGLARTRTNVVPGQGVEHPEVLVIGEGPGYDEDMQGQPFVGKAGMLLDKMLSAIQLDRKTNCYIANVVKCRPPQNRDPSPDEQAACSTFLELQIHLLKPKAILCMGRISGHKISGTEAPMHELHGQFFEYQGIPAMITYHPSALLRDENLKRPAWDDLKKFRQKLNTL